MNPQELLAFNRARLLQERKARIEQIEAERGERKQNSGQTKETEEEAFERANDLFQIMWERFAPLWRGVPVDLEVPLNGTVFYSNAVMKILVEGFQGQGYSCVSTWSDRLDEHDERIQIFDKDGKPATKDGKLQFEKTRYIRISQ